MRNLRGLGETPGSVRLCVHRSVCVCVWVLVCARACACVTLSLSLSVSRCACVGYASLCACACCLKWAALARCQLLRLNVVGVVGFLRGLCFQRRCCSDIVGGFGRALPFILKFNVRRTGVITTRVGDRTGCPRSGPRGPENATETKQTHIRKTQAQARGNT